MNLTNKLYIYITAIVQKNVVIEISVSKRAFFLKQNINNLYFKIILTFPFMIYTFFRYWLFKTSKDILMSSFELVVSKKCNLSCEGCATLMDLYENPQNMDIHQITEDLFNFLDLIYYVEEVRLLGGEPFLNRSLSYLLENIFSNKNVLNKIGHIRFTTNGTVIPDEKTISSLKKYKHKIIISVTNYGEISKKIIKTLEDNDINFVFSVEDEWYDRGDLKKKNRNIHELNKLFDICSAKSCNTLLDGKFYLCPIQAHGINISKIHNDGNFLDLRSNDSKEFKINKLKKLKLLTYIDACDYCDWPLRKVLTTKKELL
ncbi:MAG: radical SAM protein [Methanobrevibacter sp.]|nr:radical SAM protein [Candidatus Methanoflexus mossambicus]